jgi:hypothetical protein
MIRSWLRLLLVLVVVASAGAARAQQAPPKGAPKGAPPKAVPGKVTPPAPAKAMPPPKPGWPPSKGAPAKPPPPAPLKGEAKQRLDRGIALARGGDHGAALEQLEKARTLADHPLIDLHLGLSYEAAGRSDRAVDALERALVHRTMLPPMQAAQGQRIVDKHASTLATLEVATNIDGATVVVDHHKRGVAPLAAMRVAAGSHRVDVFKDGFIPVGDEVSLSAGSTRKLQLSLKPTNRKLARLKIGSALPDAEIWLSGVRRGSTPAPEPLVLMPGSYRVELRRSGYEPASQEVKLAEGATLDVALEPKALPGGPKGAMGRLTLSISEKGSSVSINGQKRQRYKGPIELSPGRHMVSVSRRGFVTAEREIMITAKETTKLVVTLEPTTEYKADYRESSTSMRTAAWGAVIGGSIFVAGGIALIVGALVPKSDLPALENEFDTQCEARKVVLNPQELEYCYGQADNSLQNRLNAKRNVVRTLEGVGGAAIALGVVSVATGIILVVIGDDPDKYEDGTGKDSALRRLPRLAVGGETTPGGGLLTLEGAF